MQISLTDKAATEIKRIMAEQAEEGQQIALRVAVRGGGCAGIQWKLELDPEPPRKQESVIEQDGLTIIADHRSALYVDGLRIDFVSNLDRMGFVCDNPTIKTACGCSSSLAG